MNGSTLRLNLWLNVAIGLHLADYLTTLIGLYSGLATEWNPIVLKCIQIIGHQGFALALLKTVVIGPMAMGFGISGVTVSPVLSTILRFALTFHNSFYFMVVLNNLIILVLGCL